MSGCELERGRVPDGGATARAMDYSLKHWTALTRNLDDGDVPVDNNHLENQIRPWAMGRKAWLFAGSELAGQRAAIVMSLVQSAKLNGHDPWAYLRTCWSGCRRIRNSRIEELLPHRWQPADLSVDYDRGAAAPSSRWCGQPLTKSAESVAAIEKLISEYHPSALILEEASKAESKRGPRIRALLDMTARPSGRRRNRRLSLHAFRRTSDVHDQGARTRPEIAPAAITAQIPAFMTRLPPVRKIWMSEDPQQSLFDAAALGLTFFARATRKK